MLAAAILATVAGFFAYRATLSDRSVAEPVAELMRLSLPDVSGKDQSLAQWRDKILIVNFWATWCEPCREEIPGLVRARDKLLSSNVEFVGIAIDQVAKVVDFARNVHVSYPLLMADATGLDLVRTLGNPSGGLPFTVVLDRKGMVAHRNLGSITQQKIEDQVAPMLAA